MLVASLLLVGCTTAERGDSTEAAGAQAVDWLVIGPVDWQMADGEFAASGLYEASGYLVSEQTFTDLRLSLEFWIDEATNSGVFVRCSDPQMVSPLTCYEANIWDDHTNQESRTGAIVMHTPPLVRVDTVGRWNTLEVTAIGSEIRYTVNGQLTAVIQDDAHVTGHIALQYGGERGVRFRNLDLEQF